MAHKILNSHQIKILKIIGKDKELCQGFYLTGGTALAEYYLQHRLSEDLDFFSEKEFNVEGISVFFAKNKKSLGIKKIDFQQSFNRNLFFLYLKNEIIKTEFTYFPFLRIEKKNKFGELFIDSLIDIAVNKIFTIYQNPRSRDFIDLFLIIKKTDWKIDDLISKARIKFDWHIDFLKLGVQFIKAKEVKDYPRMILDIKNKDWQNFYIQQAKKFRNKIIKIDD